jgi:hypothetical protein
MIWEGKSIRKRGNRHEYSGKDRNMRGVCNYLLWAYKLGLTKFFICREHNCHFISILP